MRRLATLTLGAVLTLAAHTGAAAASGASRPRLPRLPRPPPVAEQAAEQASRVGHWLYVLDRASWVSTDALNAAVPDIAAAGIRGWVVDAVGYHLEAIYYRLEGDQPFAVFTADVQDGEVTASRLVPAGAAQALNPRQTRMVQARMAAMRTDVRSCTEGGMNTVVFPPSRPDDPIDVYMLSAQAKVGELPFGGHYKLTVDKAGQVTAQQTLTKGCTNLPVSAPGDDRPMMVTHSLEATPSEIHVFEAMQMQAPIYVMTPAALPDSGAEFRVWRVRGDRIDYLATRQLDTAPEAVPVP